MCSGSVNYAIATAVDYEVAAQIATHSPSDKSNINIKEAAQLSLSSSV
jgi:hypothetical protein